MMNRMTILGATVLIAQCLVFYGCSSGGGAASDAATSSTGGAGGSSTGAGGSGSGTCDKGGAANAIGSPCVSVKNNDPCNMDGVAGTADDTACWNTCGPNKTGTKNCTCVGGTWSCPTCDYDISMPSRFACYKTTGSVACPADPTDPTGQMLPISGGECTQTDMCKPCGSGSAVSYRDSSNAPKAGWCVCVPSAMEGTPAKYSCASVKEWAPQCN